MKNSYKALFLALLSTFLLTNNLFAQRKTGIEYSGFFDSYYFRGPLNFTAGGGLTTVNGDICEFFGCDPSYFASVGASYQLWPRTYFGGEISYASLQGSRNDSLQYSFTNTVIQVDAFVRFLLIDKTVTRHSQLRDNPYYIRPYIMTGVGVAHSLNPEFNYNTNVATPENNTIEYGFPNLALTVPVGLGFQIWFSHRVSIMPEFVYRFAFTDQLDGVDLSSDKSGIDAYATIGLKLQITPTAKRVRKKKRSLAPPEEYTGPKGTDYPRKTREEEKPKQYGRPLPGDTPDNGGGWDSGDDQNQDSGGWDTGGDQQDDGGWDTGGDQQDDGGWGTEGGQQDDGGWDTGGDQNQEQNSNDDWGW